MLAMENVYVYFASFLRAAKRAGWPQERIDAVISDAKSGDYDHAVSTLLAETSEAQEKHGMSIPKGSRVEPTDLAIENGAAEPGRLGILVGYARSNNGVRLLLDGNKNSTTYWAGFWKLAEDNTDLS
jgi:hypothetical protein